MPKKKALENQSDQTPKDIDAAVPRKANAGEAEPLANKANTFLAGVNLPPLEEGGKERRFEAGDEIPELSPKERKALIDGGAISKKG